MKWTWETYFGPRTFRDGDCIRWAKSKTRLGYGACTKLLGEVRTHRASWALTNGPITSGMAVLHKCDVRDCVNPEHLFLGTQIDNIADMCAKGRLVPPSPKIGSKNKMSVLNEDTAWEIRAVHSLKKFSQAEIAKSYGLSPMTVSRLINRKLWKHVGPNWPFSEDRK